jgi:hypothetical protein
MKTHRLKIDPAPFQAVVKGLKPFEYRKNDRDFQVGDLVLLTEWEKGAFTGKEICETITYILHGGQYGIPEGYCIFSFEKEPKTLRPIRLSGRVWNCGNPVCGYSIYHGQKYCDHCGAKQKW